MTRTRHLQRLGWIGFLATILSLASCSRNTEDKAPAQAFGTTPRASQQGENGFASLIQKYSRGKPVHSAWSGYWWPFLENGIYNTALSYENAARKEGAAQWELEHHGTNTPGALPWFGHCNGWSAAAVLFNEPRNERTFAGVPFSIGDQKALLSELGQEVNADFYGTRADSDDASDPAFQDIFPDQFLLVLTNLVGKGHSLIMDRYTGSQIWNHPIAGYEISPITPDDDLGADPSAPDVYRVMVTVQVWWLRDDVAADHITEPFEFSDGESYASRILRFEAWVDAPLRFDTNGKLVNSGKLILSHQGDTVYGGAWRMSGSDLLNSHPDYLWAPYSLAPGGQYSNPQIDPSVVNSIVNQRI